jgi:excisionase family DNA binding protein
MLESTHPRIFYGVDEASAATSLSRSALYGEMAAGRLEYVRYGTRRLIPAEALERFARRLAAETEASCS